MFELSSRGAHGSNVTSGRRGNRTWSGACGSVPMARGHRFLTCSPTTSISRRARYGFFQDWEDSSARAQRVYEHWALDVRDFEHKGGREIGFIPRPLNLPKERLEAGDASVHILMDRIEAIDGEMGLPFAWFFLMTHGNKVSPEVGETIAKGLRDGRVCLPDHDAKVLLRWVGERYIF